MENAITSAIVDDEKDARDRMEKLLGKINGIRVVVKEGNAARAITKILKTRPEIVFIDVEMPGMTGFEVIGRIRENGFSPVFVFVTAYDQYAIKAIKKEAFDYLIKPVDLDELKESVARYTQQRNGQHINPKTLPGYRLLSAREEQVLDMIIRGLTSKEIAKDLYISKCTVDTHRRNLLKKLGFHTTTELFLSLQK